MKDTSEFAFEFYGMKVAGRGWYGSTIAAVIVVVVVAIIVLMRSLMSG